MQIGKSCKLCKLKNHANEKIMQIRKLYKLENLCKFENHAKKEIYAN
jgi:hypothetical protein